MSNTIRCQRVEIELTSVLCVDVKHGLDEKTIDMTSCVADRNIYRGKPLVHHVMFRKIPSKCSTLLST